MRVMKRRHDGIEDVDLPRSTVGEECDAFLAGRLVPFRWPDGSPTPVWAWLNETAHAGTDHIVEVAARPVTTETPVPERTRTMLARALLGVGPVEGIADLQSNVLVPLELELVGETMTPRRLVEVVARALYA